LAAGVHFPAPDGALVRAGTLLWRRFLWGGGVVYLTLVAVLFGKAMIETKGLAVPVFMHLWGDVVLYILLALGSD